MTIGCRVEITGVDERLLANPNVKHRRTQHVPSVVSFDFESVSTCETLCRSSWRGKQHHFTFTVCPKLTGVTFLHAVLDILGCVRSLLRVFIRCHLAKIFLRM